MGVHKESVDLIFDAIKENAMVYEQLLAVYKKMTTQQSELAAMLVEL